MTSTDVPQTLVYLAGKIAKNDWRKNRGEWDYSYGNQFDPPYIEPWPISPVAGTNALSMTGPYFAACDHGCAHGPATHGVGAYDEGVEIFDGEERYYGGCVGSAGESLSRKETRNRCFKAIWDAQWFFLWLDEENCTAYGSLVELGLASAFGKRIFISGTEQVLKSVNEDLWFGLGTAEVLQAFASPAIALSCLNVLVLNERVQLGLDTSNSDL